MTQFNISEITVREMQLLRMIATLDSEILSDSFWNLSAWENLDLNRFGLYFVEDGVKLIGFLLFDRVDRGASSQWYNLLKIAVCQEYRQKGVGRQLLSKLHQEAVRFKVDRVVLEVRLSNNPAQEFYRVNGYKMLHRAKAYYSDSEDALIFEYKIIH